MPLKEVSLDLAHRIEHYADDDEEAVPPKKEQ